MPELNFTFAVFAQADQLILIDLEMTTPSAVSPNSADTTVNAAVEALYA